MAEKKRFLDKKILKPAGIIDQMAERRALLQEQPIKAPARETAGEKPDRQRFLRAVLKVYRSGLESSVEAAGYLEQRGLKSKDKQLFFQTGYCEGSHLLSRLSGAELDDLKRIGLITDEGSEYFRGCLVWPVFDEWDNIVSFYGRRLTGSNEQADLYLKGQPKSLFNRKASQVYPDQVILTGCLLDALSLAELGFNNVQSCYDVNGYTDEMLLVHKSDRVREIIVAFSPAEAGKSAAGRLKSQLVGEGFKVRLLFAPRFQDWNEELRHGIEAGKIRDLIQEAELLPAEKPDQSLAVEIKKGSYYFQLADLTYRVIGFNPAFTTALKLNIRVYRAEKSAFKVLNLYQESSLDAFVRSLSDQFGISAEIIGDHFDRLIVFFEEERERLLAAGQSGPRVYVLNASEESRALDVLTGSDLFSDHLFPDLEKMGLVGELVNKQACYLAVVSRLSRRPLNICTLSTYGSGKSFLHDTIHKLVPDEDLKSYARITKNDLYYREEENAFLGKVLSIDEIEGLGESLYSIRTLISSGFLSISYTRMNPETGQLGSRENKVIGRPSIFCTGTSDQIIDEETLSRFLLLTTDISNEQRFKIKQRQFYEMTLEGMREKRLSDTITAKHKNILRMIKKIDVVFPPGWKPALEELKDGHYSIRENLCYLGLINAFAIKEQHTRKQYQDHDGGGGFSYIEALKSDVEQANLIMREIFGKSIFDLTPPQRHFLRSVQEYARQQIKGKNLGLQDITFYEKDIRDFSGMSAWQVNHYLGDLLKLEYIVLDSRGKHNRKSYRLLIEEHVDDLTASNTKYLCGLLDPGKL